MALANTQIALQTLDPDTNKANFISWLQSQSIFRDYNFSGSNINTLLDVLARNTYLNAFYLNMTFSETFNDSAQLRDSLISIAKEMNYIPFSMSSSVATIDLAISANLNFFEIPKGTLFAGQNSNGSFYFVTDQNYIATSTNGYFLFSNVNIYEGSYINDIFTVDNSLSNQLFTFSNPTIDTSSLTIVVSEDAGSTNTIFTQATNLYGLNGSSNVYFLQAAASNTYQFQFGDGVTGYQPQNGAIVIGNYRVTAGDAANFINTFSMSTNLSNFNSASVTGTTITTSSSSSGGSQIEDIESIRFRNPRHFQTQGNAITANDYKDLILETFPSINDVNVYGGGITANAVQFGKIFVAAVGKGGYPLTNTIKNSVISYLSDKNVVPFPVTMVDPNYISLVISTNVHVDFTPTNVSENQYKSLVTNNIINFSKTNLESFGKNFRFSQFTKMIDNLDSSIISNETEVKFVRYANVNLNTNTSLVITFKNPIQNVISSQFFSNGVSYEISDQNGILYYFPTQNYSSSILTQAGTIDYGNGIIQISSLNISAYPSNSSGLYFTVNGQNQDFYVAGNDILKIDPLQLNINIVSD